LIENAGVENEGGLKCRQGGNAGVENARGDCRGGKRRIHYGRPNMVL